MQLQSLTILKRLEEDALVSALLAYRAEKTDRRYAELVAAMFRTNAQEDAASYVADLVLKDENAFSVTAAAKKTPSSHAVFAMKHDLLLLYELLFFLQPSDFFAVLPPKKLFYGNWGNQETVTALSAYYAANGYGIWLGHAAFRFEGSISPVDTLSPIRLSDLKGYVREKEIVGDNILSFLTALPFSNMLLYGDRGTGKSSTVHAMLNEYAPMGLRLVELPKEHLTELSALRKELSSVPLKFIIFIDDLSLEENDLQISTLKAALEGSVTDASDNIMIVATTNRRHIVRESFAERENSVHASDQLEEQLSLSDRFGLSVYFATTGKLEYLDIVRRLADDMELNYDRDALCALAERWALLKGGRSPRRAKQFVQLACAYVSQGKEIRI